MKKKDDKVTERNTLRFRLKVRCKRNKKAPSDTTNPDELYLNSKVYTRTIEWEPIGDQKNWIPGWWTVITNVDFYHLCSLNPNWIPCYLSH